MIFYIHGNNISWFSDDNPLHILLRWHYESVASNLVSAGRHLDDLPPELQSETLILIDISAKTIPCFRHIVSYFRKMTGHWVWRSLDAEHDL